MSDVRRFRVEVLTPVHVGSGRQFKGQLDVVALRDVERGAHDGWALVDFERAIASLPAAAVPAVADALTRWVQSQGRGTVSQAAAQLARHGVLEPFVLQRWPGRRSPLPEIIREGMRMASGVPVLPGSSVKGALRTALWVGWFRRLPQHQQQQLLKRALQVRSAANVERKLFRPGGKQPHDDILRALRVTDAPFEDSTLRLAVVAVVSPSKRDPKRRKERLAVEVLPPGATAPIEIALDDVLLGTPARTEHSGSEIARFVRSDNGSRLGFAGALSWSGLRTAVNAVARDALNREVEYVRRLGDDQLYAVLVGLQERMEQAMGRGAWVLRVGWGQGWEGTTGAWVPPRQREPLKNRKKRESYFAPAFAWFPKTRRIVEALNDGVPPGGYPQVLGWVALWPDAAAWVAPLAPALRVEPPTRDRGGEPSEPAPPAEPVEPQIVRKFLAVRPHEYASKLAGLVEEAKGSEPAVRVRFAQVVLEELEKTGKRKDLLKGKRKREKWQARLATLEEWAREEGGPS